MKMRQSIAQIERAFVEEVELDRVRRQQLHRNTKVRARERRLYRQRQAGSFRFFLLALSMVATAVIVTVVMFRTLSLVVG